DRTVTGVQTCALPISQAEADVVSLHDFANFIKVRVEEVFLMVRQAPLGQDGAAARDDAGEAPGGQRHVAQQHAGVDGEIVHALRSEEHTSELQSPYDL